MTSRVTCALEILLNLHHMDISGRRGLLRGFLPIVKSLLDDLFRMNSTQYRMLFRLCIVHSSSSSHNTMYRIIFYAPGDDIDSLGDNNDDVMILIRKYFSFCDDAYVVPRVCPFNICSHREIAVVGYIAFLANQVYCTN